MSIYTKRGDQGETDISGKCISKNSDVIKAIGAIDELNAAIGLEKQPELKETIDTIQRHLHQIGAMVAGYRGEIKEEDITFLEKTIDDIEKEIGALKNFILPEGHLHLARSICRRAERKCIAANTDEIVIKYLNRLSDTLFMLARQSNKLKGNKEESV